MATPEDKQSKRLIRIILISWFLGLILGIIGVTYATVEISKIKQSQAEIANRPTTVVQRIETQLQPIYTTIEGEKGDKGDIGEPGKDSISTHTQTTTVIKTETAVPGPTGKTGKSGTNGREVELAQDEQGRWYQRYAGNTEWTLVPIITGLLP